MIIKTKDLPELDGERNPLVMKKVIQREDQSEDISITWVKIWGYHKKLVCHVSDRAYYIIEGTGEFNVEGYPTGKVNKGDHVFIPKGVPYDFEGHMTYFGDK
jgi:Mannose-6-phosphate isomerase